MCACMCLYCACARGQCLVLPSIPLHFISLSVEPLGPQTPRMCALHAEDMWLLCTLWWHKLRSPFLGCKHCMDNHLPCSGKLCKKQLVVNSNNSRLELLNMVMNYYFYLKFKSRHWAWFVHNCKGLGFFLTVSGVTWGIRQPLKN